MAHASVRNYLFLLFALDGLVSPTQNLPEVSVNMDMTWFSSGYKILAALFNFSSGGMKAASHTAFSKVWKAESILWRLSFAFSSFSWAWCTYQWLRFALEIRDASRYLYTTVHKLTQLVCCYLEINISDPLNFSGFIRDPFLFEEGALLDQWYQNMLLAYLHKFVEILEQFDLRMGVEYKLSVQALIILAFRGNILARGIENKLHHF